MKQFISSLIVVFAVAVLPSARASDTFSAVKPDENTPVVVSAELVQVSEATAQLQVHAEIADGFHIYAQSQPKPFLAAVISVDEPEADLIAGPFAPDRQPSIRNHDSLNLQLHEFEHSVTWTAEISLAAELSSREINGAFVYQACTADRCLAPRKLPFTAAFADAGAAAVTDLPAPVDSGLSQPNIQDDDPSGSRQKPPAEQVQDKFAISSDAASFQLSDIQAKGGNAKPQSVFLALPFAFLAGFLLNFMPCVLPVVGLKVLSFVEQAGHDRRRMILLNSAYSAGLISVMLVLASLAVFAGLGWGEQFSSVRFSVTLAIVVFAFGLSFLGVWEIPVPGLVSSAAAGGADRKEGLSGAFSKGILSTVLATPCSGPFLGSALAWAVSQPAYLTYLVFLTVGLGMASPYLLIGLFPKLVSFLPKPGNWMVTFKQVMGFVLLGTVVYLMSFLPIPALVPTVVVLLGVGMACWLLGATLLIGTRSQKLRTSLQAAVITASAVLVGFGWLHGVMAERFELAAHRLVGSEAIATEASADDEIFWQPFSQESLQNHIQDGRTVFVDFTADWCLTCKSNEAIAIETEAVRNVLKERGIVAVRADKTRPAPEVDELLRQLGNSAASIPFYAVFPAGRPDRPIVLDGVFTSPEPVVNALDRASRDDSRQAKEIETTRRF